jgi:nicotinate-nucleotide adenylyltransferase
MKRKIGLFMGSFNPVHIGHMIIANYMLEFTDLDEILFIVSPQNPFKTNLNLLSDERRLHMVELAISDTKNMSVSDIEFSMKKPSYTVDTLKELTKNNNNEYHLIIGSDNLESFTKWYKYDEILNLVKLYVYKRKGYDKYDLNFVKENDIKLFTECPEIEMSSTFIRKNIDKNLKYFLPGDVSNYIKTKKLYKL